MASPDWRASFRDAGPYLSLGIQMGFTVIFFAAGGYLADRHFDTLPWLTILGGMIGLGALILQLTRALQDMNSRSNRRRK